MHFIRWSSPFLSIATLATASIIPRSADYPPLRDVWQFPNETWIENIAIRSNGQLLVTLLSTPELYQVNPTGTQEPTLVYRFPEALGLLGIAELESDVFGVISGNFSVRDIANFTAANTPGRYPIISQ